VSDDTVYSYSVTIERVGDYADGFDVHNGYGKAAVEHLLKGLRKARERGYISGDFKVLARVVMDPSEYVPDTSEGVFQHNSGEYWQSDES
jgi:hypothetical protein